MTCRVKRKRTPSTKSFRTGETKSAVATTTIFLDDLNKMDNPHNSAFQQNPAVSQDLADRPSRHGKNRGRKKRRKSGAAAVHYPAAHLGAWTTAPTTIEEGLILSNPIYDTHPHDVLAGRGGKTNKHDGNVLFRAIVENNKMLYKACEKPYRPLVAKSIILCLERCHNPPTRFLKQREISGPYYELNQHAKLKKVCQALRENMKELPELLEEGAGAAAAASEQEGRAPGNKKVTVNRAKGETNDTSVASEPDGDSEEIQVEKPPPLASSFPTDWKSAFQKKFLPPYGLFKLPNSLVASFKTIQRQSLTTTTLPDDQDDGAKVGEAAARPVALAKQPHATVQSAQKAIQALSRQTLQTKSPKKAGGGGSPKQRPLRLPSRWHKRGKLCLRRDYVLPPLMKVSPSSTGTDRVVAAPSDGNLPLNPKEAAWPEERLTMNSSSSSSSPTHKAKKESPEESPKAATTTTKNTVKNKEHLTGLPTTRTSKKKNDGRSLAKVSLCESLKISAFSGPSPAVDTAQEEEEEKEEQPMLLPTRWSRRTQARKPKLTYRDYSEGESEGDDDTPKKTRRRVKRKRRTTSRSLSPVPLSDFNSEAHTDLMHLFSSNDPFFPVD